MNGTDPNPVDPVIQQDDIETDLTQRPKTLSEMLGQEKVKEQLRIAIQATLHRERQWTTCSSTVLQASARRRWHR